MFAGIWSLMYCFKSSFTNMSNYYLGVFSSIYAKEYKKTFLLLNLKPKQTYVSKTTGSVKYLQGLEWFTQEKSVLRFENWNAGLSWKEKDILPEQKRYAFMSGHWSWIVGVTQKEVRAVCTLHMHNARENSLIGCFVIVLKSADTWIFGLLS